MSPCLLSSKSATIRHTNLALQFLMKWNRLRQSTRIRDNNDKLHWHGWYEISSTRHSFTFPPSIPESDANDYLQSHKATLFWLHFFRLHSCCHTIIFMIFLCVLFVYIKHTCFVVWWCVIGFVVFHNESVGNVKSAFFSHVKASSAQKRLHENWWEDFSSTTLDRQWCA